MATPDEDTNDSAFAEVLNDVASQGDDGIITLEEVVTVLESRGFGALLFVPSFIANTPLANIIGLASTCGLFIILIAVQLLIGKKSPWLPRFLLKLSVTTPRYERIIKFMDPALTFIDKNSRVRLEMLTHDTAQRVIALMSIILAISFVPLEVVPLATHIPASALMLFALGLILRDGLVTLLGFIVALPMFYFAAKIIF